MKPKTAEGIKFNLETWKIRVRDRSNNRMKLHINLNKDEAVAFKNFSDICKPEDVAQGDFMKTIFLTGIEAMNQQLADLVRKYAEENKDELAASGITVLEGEDGNVKLAETASYEADLSGGPSIKEGVLHDDEIQRIMDSEEEN
jgi:hypothetical protein